MLFCANSGTFSDLLDVARFVVLQVALFSIGLTFSCQFEPFFGVTSGTFLFPLKLGGLGLVGSLTTDKRSNTVDLILAVLLLTLPAMLFAAGIEFALVEFVSVLLVGSYLLELTEFDFLSMGFADVFVEAELALDIDVSLLLALDFGSNVFAKLFSSFTIDNGRLRPLFVIFSVGDDLFA